MAIDNPKNELDMKKTVGLLNSLKEKFGSPIYFHFYIVGYLISIIYLMANIILLKTYHSYLIDGVEKVGEVINVGRFSKGTTYISKVKKDNSNVRFHSYYDFIIGENVYLLVKPDQPSEGILGRKSSSLFTLFVYKNGGEDGTIFYFIIMSFPILLTPVITIVQYIKYKRYGTD